MQVCYIEYGESTRKCQIIRILPSGKYELKPLVEVQRPDGSKYYGNTCSIIVSPERLKDIHEEEGENGENKATNN